MSKNERVHFCANLLRLPLSEWPRKGAATDAIKKLYQRLRD